MIRWIVSTLVVTLSIADGWSALTDSRVTNFDATPLTIEVLAFLVVPAIALIMAAEESARISEAIGTRLRMRRSTWSLIVVPTSSPLSPMRLPGCDSSRSGPHPYDR